MPGSATENFRDFLRGQLGRLSGPAVEELRSFLEQNNAGAHRLEVVIRTNGLTDGLPIVLTFLDPGRAPLPGGTFLLGGVLGPVIPPDQVDALRRFDEAGVEILEVGLQILLEWFISCWLAAGGLDLPIPAALRIPDDIEFFDLKQLAWIPNRDC